MNKLPKVGIGVLVINEKQEILLGARKAKHGEGLWGLPGGHLEFGESPEICAIREVYEETGLTIENVEFFAFTNDIYVDEDKHYISIFMTARYLNNRQIINSEQDKCEKWQWFRIDQLPGNLFLPLKQLINNKSYGRKLSELKYAKNFNPSKERYIKEVGNNIVISEPGDEKINKIILNGLNEYNKSIVGPYEFIPFNIHMHDEKSQVIAGMQGDIFGKLASVSFFWVKENYRKQGIGTKLIKVLEDYAKQKQCQIIQLITADFQAQDFYVVIWDRVNTLAFRRTL